MGIISLQICKLNKTRFWQCQAEVNIFMYNFRKGSHQGGS